MRIKNGLRSVWERSQNIQFPLPRPTVIALDGTTML